MLKEIETQDCKDVWDINVKRVNDGFGTRIIIKIDKIFNHMISLDLGIDMGADINALNPARFMKHWKEAINEIRDSRHK